MTQEEIVKYTDHLLAEFYKDCQKQYNKDNRQIDIVLSNGDFSTLQNVLCDVGHTPMRRICNVSEEVRGKSVNPNTPDLWLCDCLPNQYLIIDNGEFIVKEFED